MVSNCSSKTSSNKRVLIRNCMMSDDGASLQPHALHSTINVQYISNLILKLYDFSVNHHQQILTLKQYQCVFIANVAAFILQVTRVLYFSQCNPEVRIIKSAKIGWLCTRKIDLSCNNKQIGDFRRLFIIFVYLHRIVNTCFRSNIPQVHTLATFADIYIYIVVLGAEHKAKRLVLQYINGVSSNPVEGRTNI